MTLEQGLVLALVRALAQPTAERLAEVHDLASAADPERVLALLATQRMVTRLGGRLLDDPAVALPDQLADAIGAARKAARHRGLFDHALTARLAHVLEDDGVPVVALKGAALADAVYGDVGARQSSDIDLLVAPADLDEAVGLAGELGWSEPEWARPGTGLPRLHRVLSHASLPPVELHWRVHWYEPSFATTALARAPIAAGGLRRLLPADELAFLLLFLARDGLAGLRQTVDVAAWWGSLGRAEETAAGVRAIADGHPALAPALTTAAEHAERLSGIPSGSLLAPPRRLSPPQRAALRLANPWLDGSRQQIAAEVSLIDGLLSPAGGVRAFARRQIFPPDQILIGRRHELHRASPARMASARVLHATRVLGRYALAPARVIARRRG